MRRLLLAMAILALASGVAFAGPNAGVILAVQGNVLGVDTLGDPCANIALPGTCEEMIPASSPDPGGLVDWFLAVVVSPLANTPNFNTVVFGLGAYDSGLAYVGFFGPCVVGALEVTTTGWPGPGTGTAVSWSPDCLYGYMEPVYYFGIYIYGSADVPLTDHPVQDSGVVDCSANPVTDLFGGYGAMGVGGSAGSNPDCPGVEPVPWACCFGPTCVMLTQDDCTDQGGDSWHDGVECGPNDEPCDGETPTQDTTWGSIKNIYR